MITFVIFILLPIKIPTWFRFNLWFHTSTHFKFYCNTNSISFSILNIVPVQESSTHPSSYVMFYLNLRVWIIPIGLHFIYANNSNKAGISFIYLNVLHLIRIMWCFKNNTSRLSNCWQFNYKTIKNAIMTQLCAKSLINSNCANFSVYNFLKINNWNMSSFITSVVKFFIL